LKPASCPRPSEIEVIPSSPKDEASDFLSCRNFINFELDLWHCKAWRLCNSFSVIQQLGDAAANLGADDFFAALRANTRRYVIDDEKLAVNPEILFDSLLPARRKVYPLKTSVA